jgi:cation:H+ antiporter
MLEPTARRLPAAGGPERDLGETFDQTPLWSTVEGATFSRGRIGHPPVLHLLLLLGSAVAIYVASELFVNAIEHLGRYLNVGTLAVGTVLAALGTALPESVVTGIAVTDRSREQLGIGAALGGPLALATIGYGVIGLSLLVRRRPLVQLDAARLQRDQRWFLMIFVANVTLGLVAFSFKPLLGLMLFAAYAGYVIVELRAESTPGDEVDLEPLTLTRSATPGILPVLAQTLTTLVVVFIASQVFVAQLEWAGPQLGLSSAVVALLLAPVATELPEVMNALIWVRQGKTQLALSNMSGSMMVQTTVPSGLALLYTSWDLNGPLLLSGGVTAAAVVFLLVALRRNRLSARWLAGAAGFYLVFAALLPVV